MKKLLFLNFSERLHYSPFKSLEKEFDVEVEFEDFNSVIVSLDTILIGTTDIRSYDFVLLGTLGKHLELALYVEDFLIKNKIAYFKYGLTRDKGNKLNELQLFRKLNLPHIPTIISKLTTKRLTYILQSSFSFPLVVKPIDGSKGNGVSKVDDLKGLIELISLNKDSDKLYLLQPFVPNSGDYRVFVLKDKILGIMKRTSQSEDEFRSNISLGGIGEKSDLPENVKSMVLNVVKDFNLDIAGVDIIQNKETGEYLIMEVNQAPQFEGLKKYLNVPVESEILRHIIAQK